jgi:gamma-glutamylcysteine synthetase
MTDAAPLSRNDLIGAMSKGAKPKAQWRIGAEHEKFGFDRSTLRRPTFLVSTGPSSFDLKQTFARTKQAFDKGQIPKAEYEKQAALIRQWMQVYKPPAPRPQPAK